MIDSSERIGPLLCCIEYHRMLGNALACAAHRWGASHSECGAGPAQRCEGAYAGCRGRLWMLPAEHLAAATTEQGVLHHHLSQKGARMRDVSSQSQGTRVREACHV
jgi:hypothetical protein